ncbi:MAG: hypothetical protein OXI76_05215 [Gemmatimonadota bacterium]|nr:hypothetical protein [Gemmatimonadota bacterium]
MGDDNHDRAASRRDSNNSGPGIPAGLLVALIVAVLALFGIGARYHLSGDVNFVHCLFSVFFSLNLLICYWEACLFFRHDYIEARAGYWRSRHRETGRTPAVEFLATRVPLRRILSPRVWADAWATYSMIDASYTDRRTLGFTVDIGNGFVTPIPTLILYAAYTLGFLPAIAAGIIGAMLFWQWVYVSSLYWVSFFVAGRQVYITRGELYTYVIAPNAIWILIPLLGLYVSVRLILEGNYGILGF